MPKIFEWVKLGGREEGKYYLKKKRGVNTSYHFPMSFDRRKRCEKHFKWLIRSSTWMNTLKSDLKFVIVLNAWTWTFSQTRTNDCSRDDHWIWNYFFFFFICIFCVLIFSLITIHFVVFSFSVVSLCVDGRTHTHTRRKIENKQSTMGKMCTQFFIGRLNKHEKYRQHTTTTKKHFIFFFQSCWRHFRGAVNFNFLLSIDFDFTLLSAMPANYVLIYVVLYINIYFFLLLVLLLFTFFFIHSIHSTYVIFFCYFGTLRRTHLLLNSTRGNNFNGKNTWTFKQLATKWLHKCIIEFC